MILIASSPNDTISQEISKRIDKIEILENTWVIHDIEKVKAGELALVFPYFVFYIYKNNLISDDFQEDIDFHISKYGYGENCDEMEPYHVLTNKITLNETLTEIFDFV